MQIPFSTDQFLAVFGEYNRAVWPAQIVLVAFGVGLTLLSYLGPGRDARWTGFGLAALWAWMGAVYHLGFFRKLTPAGLVFGIAFLVQSLLFVAWALRRSPGDTRRVTGPQAWLGLTLMGYALAVYPLLGWVLGHRYPANPTFGLPCPTTIATFALLLWASPRPPWWLLAIPLLWMAVGTAAAVGLGISEDLGLLGAGVIACAWLLAQTSYESSLKARRPVDF